jgi:ABC-2 type transport system ATP-binding protein
MEPLTIETVALSRRFGSVTAVSELGLQVPAGAVYGFLGPNGAGKTTTIRMLLGLIRPHAGEVRLWGKPLQRHRLELLRRTGSLVETPSLYPHLTGRENLEIIRRLRQMPAGHVDRALATVRLEADAGRLVREYSLGMRNRLGLAQALRGDPDLLILDEPANGLDPAGIHDMRDLVRHLAQERGITVFLSSHLLSEIEHVATHVGIVQGGRLLFQGPLEELQQRREERLVLEVNDVDKASSVLSAAGWAPLRGEDGALSLVAAGRDEAAAVNSLLVRMGVSVFRLALERPSLERVFLRLTGIDTDAAEVAA